MPRQITQPTPAEVKSARMAAGLTRYFDEIVNMELLEGEGADDVRETACALHLQEVQGVPFYVCLDGFGNIFALAE